MEGRQQYYGGDSQYHHRSHQRKRSASRSRSNSRDRKRHHYGSSHHNNDNRRFSGERDHERTFEKDDHNSANYYGGRNSHRERERQSFEPSSTIVVKGLPLQTTEATLMAVIGPYYPKEIRLVSSKRDGGDVRNIAFVEFVSIDYAKYFMTAFAGSTGDNNAAQLIIDNRSTVLEYAKDSTSRSGTGGGKLNGKTDWICEACGCNNFARRDACFKCSNARSDRSQSIAVAASSGAVMHTTPYEKFADSLLASESRSATLVMKGFLTSVTDEQIAELFRPYAQVRQVILIQSIAYIEFYSIDHAAYVLQSVSTAWEQTSPHLKVAFARETTMRQLASAHAPSVMTQPTMPLYSTGISSSNNNTYNISSSITSAASAMTNTATAATAAAALPPNSAGVTHHQQLIAQAMQAAQWNMNNGYSSTTNNNNNNNNNSGSVTTGVGITAGTFGVDPAGMSQVNAVDVGPHPTSAAAGDHHSNNNHLVPGQLPPQQSFAYVGLPAATSAVMTKIWPPQFETNGGLYVFQPKTGYFLEPRSEFYYCPKAKLYYRAHDGQYFQYDSSLNPPFRQFVPPGPITSPPSLTADNESALATTATVSSTSSAGLVDGSQQSTSSQAGGSVKMSISLTKNNGATAGKTNNLSLVGTKKTQKDIAKWGAIQKEVIEAEQAEEEAAALQQQQQKAVTGIPPATTKDSPANTTRDIERREDRPSATTAATSITTTAVTATAAISGSVSSPVAVPAAVANSSVLLSTAASTTTTATTSSSSVAPATTTPPATNTTTSSSSSNVGNVAGHVCLLCRRQFTTAEMLTRHEKESKLHAENLAKLQSQSSQPTTQPYRDRAEERRHLYGSEPDHQRRLINPVDVDLQNATAYTALPMSTNIPMTTLLPSSSSSSLALGNSNNTSFTNQTQKLTPSTAAAVTAVAEDVHNPGNLLLRKLGWTDGQGLGRDNTGSAEAVGVTLAAAAEASQPTTAMESTLRSTLGQTNASTAMGMQQQQQQKLSRQQLNMAAARARFDEIQQK